MEKWENSCFHTNVPFKKYEKALQFLKEEKIRVILAGRVSEIDYYKFLKEQFPFVEFRINVSKEELVKLYQNCKLYNFINLKNIMVCCARGKIMRKYCLGP